MTALTVLVDLERDGTYALRLPGCPDKVPVRPGKLEQTIRTALHSQVLGQIEKTPKGGLTLAQITCLRDHSEWPDARCPLCRAAGRFATSDYKADRAKTTRVPEGITGAQLAATAARLGVSKLSRVSDKSAEDLGL